MTEITPIEEQTQLLSQLVQLVHDSAPEGYERAACTFDYRVCNEDGSSSVGGQFSYDKGGVTVSAVLAYPHPVQSMKIVPRLHEIMKGHTGGDWGSFTLTLDKSGQATTSFDYTHKCTDDRPFH